MTFKCQCGEAFPIPAGVPVVEFRCHRCGRLIEVRRPTPPLRTAVAEDEPKDLPLRWGVALAGLLVAAVSLVSLAFAAPAESWDRQSFATRTETATGDAADAASGRGRMKVVNDTGEAIAVRLVGPTAADTQTTLVAPWSEKTFDQLAAGRWTARYCLGREWQPELNRFDSTRECDELRDRAVFDERIEDGNLAYTVAVLRFGPTPREWPEADRITQADFDGD